MVTNDSGTIRRVSDTDRRKTSSLRSRKVSVDNVTAPPIVLSATELDRRLRDHVALIAESLESFGALVREAKASQIHLELGYPSWPAYFVSLVGGVMPKLRPAERREVVALLAGTEMSDYAISQALGVSYSTVARDLTIRPAERKHIVGLDGKRYPASKVCGRAQKPKSDQQEVKAKKLQSAVQGLHTAVAEFLTAVEGASPAKAKVLARQVLGDANKALGALESFFEFVEAFPPGSSGLELVGLRGSQS
jgi:hypothetical protein